MSKLLEQQLDRVGNKAKTFWGDTLVLEKRTRVKNGQPVDERELRVTFANGKPGGKAFVDAQILSSLGWASADEGRKSYERPGKKRAPKAARQN